MKWSKKRNAQHRAAFNKLKGALQSLRSNLPLPLFPIKSPLTEVLLPSRAPSFLIFFPDYLAVPKKSRTFALVKRVI